MTDTGERILDLLSKTLPGMSEAEREKILWYTEGMAAAVRSGQSGAQPGA